MCSPWSKSSTSSPPECSSGSFSNRFGGGAIPGWFASRRCEEFTNVRGEPTGLAKRFGVSTTMVEAVTDTISPTPSTLPRSSARRSGPRCAFAASLVTYPWKKGWFGAGELDEPRIRWRSELKLHGGRAVSCRASNRFTAFVTESGASVGPQSKSQVRGHASTHNRVGRHVLPHNTLHTPTTRIHTPDTALDLLESIVQTL